MMQRGKYIRTEEIRRKNSIGTSKLNRRGENHPAWKFGRVINANGYILIRKPDHPFAKGNGYIFEHRLVMEKIIGRYLRPDEVIHHRNGIKNDNRPENLQITNHREHGQIESLKKSRKCVICPKKHLARGYCDFHYWKFFLKEYRNKKHPRKYTFTIKKMS